MGIKERQERDRETTRRSILDAARELFVTEGYDQVSMRKIAERVEYSPAAIYSYFPSKDDIFFALAEEGFRLMHGSADVRNEMATLPPLEHIRRAFWHFYEFSREQPQYFALMFVDRSVPRISREYERFRFAREMKAHLIDQVQRCVDEGIFPKHVAAAPAFRLLATGLIGAASLRLSDRLAPDENADDLARDLIDVTIAGLQSGIPLRFTCQTCPLEDLEPAAAGAPASTEESSS